jgi:lysophospholipase L1-like esterase
MFASMRTAIAVFASAFLAACGGGGSSRTPPSQPSPPISNLVAFMGDSITHLWDLTQYDSGPTLNFGLDGDMLARFQSQVIAAAPGVVVILGGVDDLNDYGPAGTSVDSIRSMAAQAQAAGIRVILCSVMPPTVARFATLNFSLADVQAFNHQLIQVAQQNGYLYADYYDEFLNADGTVNDSLYVDGLHPNPAGYALMWKVVAPLIQEDLQ